VSVELETISAPDSKNSKRDPDSIAISEPRSFSPAQRRVNAGVQKANSYVQPSTFDMLAGASPASAVDGWAE
jgi:hypothetical protein